MSMASLWFSMVLHPPLLCLALRSLGLTSMHEECIATFPRESSADLVCVPGKISLPFWIICFIDLPLKVKYCV